MDDEEASPNFGCVTRRGYPLIARSFFVLFFFCVGLDARGPTDVDGYPAFDLP
jgi:hypothetical protein